MIYSNKLVFSPAYESKGLKRMTRATVPVSCRYRRCDALALFRGGFSLTVPRFVTMPYVQDKSGEQQPAAEPPLVYSGPAPHTRSAAHDGYLKARMSFVVFVS